MQMSLHLGKHYRVWLLLFLAVTCLGAAAENPKNPSIRKFRTRNSKSEPSGWLKTFGIWSSRTIKKIESSMADYDKKNRPEYRTDERKAMREQWMRQSDSVHDATMRRYKKPTGPTPSFCSMSSTAVCPSACVRKISCRFISIPPTFSAWKPSPITWS